MRKRLDSGLSSTYDPQSRSVDLHRVSDGETAPYNIYLGNLYLKLKDMTRAQRGRVDRGRFSTRFCFPKELTADELIAALALRARDSFRAGATAKSDGHRRCSFRDGCLRGRRAVARNSSLTADESIMSVSPDKLSDASISADDAYKTAAATLVRATGENQWTQISEHVWASTYEDDYDFSRLVAAGSSARFPFDGAPVVFSPSHSVCLVTDTPEGAVLTEMVEIGNTKRRNRTGLSVSCSGHCCPTKSGLDGQATREKDGHAELVLQGSARACCPIRRSAAVSRVLAAG